MNEQIARGTLEHLPMGSLSTTSDLTELEMIRAAKIIIANSNPQIYSRASLETLREHIKIQTFNSHEETENNIESQTIDLPLGADEWHKLLSMQDKEFSARQMTIERMTEEFYKEAGKQKNEKVKSTELVETIEASQERFFSSDFIDAMALSFANDPSQAFIRIPEGAHNINLRKVSNERFCSLDFFALNSQRFSFCYSYSLKHGNPFLGQNILEQANRARSDGNCISVNSVGGSLRRMSVRSDGVYELETQVETNGSKRVPFFHFKLQINKSDNKNLKFSLPQLPVLLPQLKTPPVLYLKKDGGDWQRNINSTIEGNSLEFNLNHVNENVAEVALTLPFSLTKEMPNLRKLIRAHRQNRPKSSRL